MTNSSLRYLAPVLGQFHLSIPASALRFATALMIMVFGTITLRADDDLSVPRFASVGSNKVNVRQGPGQNFNVKYQYKLRGYPVKVIAEADDWWLIEDYDGDGGWVLSRLLSGRRTLLVIGDQESTLPVALRTDPDDGAAIIAAIEPGVVLTLEECRQAWCRIEHRLDGRKYSGWVHMSHVWGGQLED